MNGEPHVHTNYAICFQHLYVLSDVLRTKVIIIQVSLRWILTKIYIYHLENSAILQPILWSPQSHSPFSLKMLRFFIPYRTSGDVCFASSCKVICFTLNLPICTTKLDVNI